MLTPEKIRQRYWFKLERATDRKIRVSVTPKGVKIAYRKGFILEFDCYLRNFRMTSGVPMRVATKSMSRNEFQSILERSLPDEIRAECIAAALIYQPQDWDLVPF